MRRPTGAKGGQFGPNRNRLHHASMATGSLAFDDGNQVPTSSPMMHALQLLALGLVTCDRMLCNPVLLLGAGSMHINSSWVKNAVIR